MSWLILTFLAITARATLSIATKLLSKRVEVTPTTQAVLFTTMGGLLSLLLTPFLNGVSFEGISTYWLAALIMITSQAFGNILYFAGLKYLDAGTAQIAFSSILIWGAILSVIFLDSTFSWMQILGILILLFSILLVQYKKGKLSLDIGIIYIVIAAALFGVFQVASADLAKQVSTGTYLILAYFGPTLILGFLYFSKIRKDFSKLKHQIAQTGKLTLFAGIASLGYFIFSYIAYQEAPDRGVVVILLTAQVVLSVIFGVIFLKETKNMPKKLVAGMLAFIASMLIK